MPPKSSFLDKVLGRIGRLDAQGLQTVVQRLARERSFLERLFNTIEDGVLVLDENGKIIYLNHAVTQLLGIQPGAAEGQSISRFLPEFDWEKFVSPPEGKGERVVRQEFEVAFPKPRYLRLYAAALDGETSGNSGLALIIHDATEARQKTFEAIESERVQALTLLSASVAHEIGNPLNALHIHLQLMEREVRKLSGRKPDASTKTRGLEEEKEVDVGAVAAKLEYYLEVARGEITRLDYIVTHFLEAIRHRAPAFALGSLNEITRETIELLRPELENRGQTIVEEYGRQVPRVRLDAAQLKQVLVNVVKNAMQAMTRGGKLVVRTGAGSEGVWVSLADTGSGIAPEQLKHIFEPFFTTKKKGTGLGLMIVQRIIRDHGGRVDLESQEGKGTTFRIWLPLHERPPRLLEAPVSPTEATT